MTNFKFSIIIAAYNSDLWLCDTINSLTSQTLNFKKNVEVIIVNDASSDNTEEICEKFHSLYPDNITYITKDKNEGPASCRNIGLEHASGEYVNFLDSDDYLSRNTLKEILIFFKANPNIDIVSIPIIFFGEKQGDHPLNFKYKHNRVVDLIKKPDHMQLSSSSSFIKRSSIGDLKFNPQLTTSEDVVFINQILLKNPKLGLCNKAKYYYRKREEKSSLIDNSSFKKEYFIPRIDYYFKFLLNECVKKCFSIPPFIQYTLMYDLQWIFKIKNVSRILSNSELEKIRYDLFNILQFISDDVIYNQKEISNKLKSNILFFKYKNRKTEKISNEIISRLRLNTVYIDIFEIKNNDLYILANIDGTDEDINVDVLVNGKKITSNIVKFPQRDKYSLNYKYGFNYSFETNIDLDKNNVSEIEFECNGEKSYIDFSRPCNFSRTVGYAKTKNYISSLKKNKIIIKKKTVFRWIKEESKALLHMLKEHERGYKTGIPIRIAYLILYPFLRNRKIWLFMDLPSIADDNGRHLFTYAVNKDEEIDKYFVIYPNSRYYNEMKKIGNVIGYKSIKHRLLILFAENIISSHPDNDIIYPFWGNYPHFAGILKSNTIFLQHGITKDNVSSWLNKYDKNLAMFLTASPDEYTSIFRYPYNYKKEEVQLLGFPRFDGLENKQKTKQILIMPSWRRYLKHKSNEVILDSNFFKTFNSLINNEKLIKVCKEYGYDVIFKPHPNVYDFIELFKQNDYVKIDYKRTKYQELFNTSSLLVTDYSSVAFDFAYLYKPVIYYHYSDDYHFNVKEGYFDYKTMGFGEIGKSEDEIVDLIIEYIKNDCKMKNHYKKNVENFFLFTDHENCKRVYETIKQLPTKD